MKLLDFLTRWSTRPGSADEAPASGSRHEMRSPLRGIPEEGIGVGDAVKRITSAFGITPCNGCEKRRKVLNRWIMKGSRSEHNRRGA